MESLTRDVRKFIYDHFRDTARAPVVEEIMSRFGLPREDVASVLKALESERQLVLLPGTGRILMAHPFSAITTPFLVTLRSGRRYFANCSWDSLAFHVTLAEPVRVDAFCHHSGEPIEIELAEQGVVWARPRETLVYFGIPAAQWWHDVIHTCSNTMVFFGSRQRMDQRKADNAMQDGEALTLEQAIELSLPIYRHKMDLDYERPGAAELSAHFAKMGLTGPFWALA